GTSRNAGKLRQAEELGLDHGVDASQGDWAVQVEEITLGDGVNAVMDLVGGDYIAGNLRVMALRGRAVVVGAVAGASAELNLGMLLGKRLHLMGTVLRSRPLEEKIALAREFSDNVLPLLSSGRIRAVVDRVYPFSQIHKAQAQ